MVKMRKLGASDTCISIAARFTTMSSLFVLCVLWGYGKV